MNPMMASERSECGERWNERKNEARTSVADGSHIDEAGKKDGDETAATRARSRSRRAGKTRLRVGRDRASEEECARKGGLAGGLLLRVAMRNAKTAKTESVDRVERTGKKEGKEPGREDENDSAIKCSMIYGSIS